MPIFLADFILLVMILLPFGVWYLRRKKDKWVLLTLSSLFSICVAYGSFILPWQINIRTEQFFLGAGSGATLHIAFLSDLHLGPYKDDSWVKTIAQALTKMHPDLILIGGDLLYQEDESYLSLLPSLQQFSQIAPTYTILGNHDIYSDTTRILDPQFVDKIKNILKNSNLHVLDNESTDITLYGRTFHLVGLSDFRTDHFNLFALFKTEFPTIVLTHNHDLIDQIKSFRFALLLAGHTHGGQIRLPFIGAIRAFLPVIHSEYDWGWYTLENGQKMFITSGIGEIMLRSRFLCPPEIVMLEI